MPIIFEERITRAEIRKHREWVYVFGDIHLARVSA